MILSKDTVGWLGGLWIIAIFAFIGGALAKTRGYSVWLGIRMASLGFRGLLGLATMPERPADPGLGTEALPDDAGHVAPPNGAVVSWSIALLWFGTGLLRFVLRFLIARDGWHVSIDAVLLIAAAIASLLMIRRWLATPPEARHHRRVR